MSYTYWVKTTTSGGLAYGIGYWMRSAVEPVLIGSRGKTIRTKERGVFLARTQGHSIKPDNLHEIAERNFPEPRLELFARRPRDGWTTIGDELTGRDIVEDITLLRDLQRG